MIKFFAVIKNTFLWFKSNIKIVLLILASIVLFIVCFSWYRKNTQIRKLEAELSYLRAKAKLDRLAIEAGTTLSELGKLSEKDLFIRESIRTLEENLKIRLPPDMTAEEIARRFRELGLP